MAALVRRVASRFVGNCSKNRSVVYLNQSCIRHLRPTVSCNVLFSTSTRKRVTSTDSLLRVIETEIGFAEQADDYDRVEETPSGFPFKMEDKPGGKNVLLTREYEGESVKVEVHMTNLVTGDDDDDDDDDDEEEEDGEEKHEDKPEKPKQSNVPILVTLSKKIGPSLEFRCTAFPDKIVIKDMWVTFPDDPAKDELAYEGPSFRVLDEKLRKAFLRYLEIRGIKPSMINFLHEYMINKDSREHLLWLKTLRNFVKS